MTHASGTLAERAEREIRELHEFFVGWFTGALGETDLAAALAAFDPGFCRIGPEGESQDYPGLATMLAGARGGVEPGFQISIEEPGVLWQARDAVLMSYVERQRSAAGANARRSAALMLSAPGAPRGVAWRFVQETWITASGGG
jgi:hypothetical protein